MPRDDKGEALFESWVKAQCSVRTFAVVTCDAFSNPLGAVGECVGIRERMQIAFTQKWNGADNGFGCTFTVSHCNDRVFGVFRSTPDHADI